MVMFMPPTPANKKLNGMHWVLHIVNMNLMTGGHKYLQSPPIKPAGPAPTTMTVFFAFAPLLAYLPTSTLKELTKRKRHDKEILLQHKWFSQQ